MHGIRDEALLSILQKYLLREWAWTFAAVFVVLFVVMLGVSLGELLNDIAGGRLPVGLLTDLITLKMPELLNTILPLGVFIAVIWGLGRLYRDQEMAVMRSSGFRWQMMLRPLFNLLLPIAAVVLVVGVFVSPAASSLAQQRLEEAFRTASEWGLQTGQFHVLQGGDLVLYVEAVERDGRSLRNVFIQQRQNGREQVWVAEKGFYWLNPESGERFLTLENGQITEGGEDALDFGIVRFSRNDLRLPEPEQRVRAPAIEARPSIELLMERGPPESAEMQWRLSPALAVIVLGLLAIPMAHSAPREGRGGRVVMGVLAYAAYANLLYMCRSWIASDALPPELGMWWVHLLVLVVALIWLRRQGRRVGMA
ncbi:LPS export ABC transporter permease LptF [Elongatibacter sediminis]|uniref:Lipopolysaccharide export system permease protein LptF n=1 Tax=Elongatibacter sediminis TaxID=3119006 RepID=A0AAW9RFN3_9GAMM